MLKQILESLPSDYNWNEEIPRELALKKAGEKRFFYIGAAEQTKGTTMEESKSQNFWQEQGTKKTAAEEYQKLALKDGSEEAAGRLAWIKKSCPASFLSPPRSFASLNFQFLRL